ncbi:hypothetical protein [Pantanalinema sp. GBBB05]|uniref:hypothetical protein n=1 Tax=Pantanalinema sp. GBBB05 TaxID=2604139 RepID=UPI001D747849|nr:hypothetical protein [Pantanalinema sp. GBBB05]
MSQLFGLFSVCLSCLSLGTSVTPVGGSPWLSQPTPSTIAQVPGWKVFVGRGVELGLPSNYRGGSPSAADAKGLIAAIKGLGAEFAQIARMVEQNPSTFVLFAVDPQLNAMGGVTNVLVAAEQVAPTLTLEAYLTTLAKILPAQIRIVDRQQVKIQGQPAGRLVTEAAAQGVRVKQLIYVIKQNRTVWTVGYSTAAEDYLQHLPLFERSIQTFKGQAEVVISQP